MSTDIGIQIYLKMKDQDKMFDALKMLKDIIESQSIMFGGSNACIVI